jgi:tetratricopeptide (TPR) repeat protein
MEVLELAGCQYAGKALPAETPGPESPEDLREAVGGWIADSVQEENPEPAPRNPVDDGLLTKWEIRRKSGEVIEFENFSLVREWIAQGKISAGDEIVPSSGSRHTVDTYPGTADLFGGALPPPTPSRRTLVGPPRQRGFRNHFTPKTLSIAGTALAVFLVAVAPFSFRSWRLREGRIFVEGLVVGLPTQNAPDLAPLIDQAKNFLREGTTESLPRASVLFLKILPFRPSDPEVLSCLAETWTEIGTLAGDRKDLERAQALISYAEALDKRHIAPRRAHVRWLWRAGRTGEALDLVKKIDSADLDTQLLRARIAASRSDFTSATIILSEALRTDPNNTALLVGLVDVFEKQGKFDEAATYLKRAEALSPNPGLYNERLKSLYRSAGDTDSLETLYRKSVAAYSLSAEADHFELIKLLNAQKRSSEVIQESLNYFADYPEGKYRGDVQWMYDAAVSASQYQEKPKPKPLRPRAPRKKGR